MKDKIGIYYHIWAPKGDLGWMLVDEQLKRLLKSNLPAVASVKCTVSGEGAPGILELVELYDWLSVAEVSPDGATYEALTLGHLYRDCVAGAVDKVLYFHTKGISHFAGLTDQRGARKLRAINSWRHLLEWGCIDQWKANVQALETNDVSGVCHCVYPWQHMSGNFFWANASYIVNLVDPGTGPFPACPHDYFGQGHRLIYERWIGLNDPSIHSLYDPPFEYARRGHVPDTSPENGEPDWFWLYRDDVLPVLLSELESLQCHSAQLPRRESDSFLLRGAAR